MIGRNRYPDNWGEIAAGVKEKAGWKCQCCGMPGLPPYKHTSYG
ncbi:MAG: hypothetical protein ACKPBT_17415 [Microcystis aeruginosa]